MQRHSWGFLVGLNAPAFSLSMIHIVNNPNIYHYVLTHFIDLGLLDRHRMNTALGALGILGLLIASTAQPIIGFLSDRTHTRLGARHPYFLAGAVLTTLALLIIIQAQSWSMLLLMVVFIQFGLNAIQSPVQALIPDYVGSSQKGLASGIKTILELLGIVTCGLIVWLLLGNDTRPTLAILVSSAILFTAICVSIWTAPPVHDVFHPLSAGNRYMRRYRSVTGSTILTRLSLIWASALRIMRHRPLMWWILSRFFFYASFNSIGKFAINYLMDVYRYSPEEARAIQGRVLMISGGVIFLVAILTGMLSDRMEQRYIAASGGVMAGSATLLLVASPDLWLAALMIAIIGVGSSVFFTAGWALVTHIVPEREAAFYLAVANLATTLGGAFGLLGGYLVDQINDHVNTPTTGYQVLFLITTLFFIMGAGAVLPIQAAIRQRKWIVI